MPKQLSVVIFRQVFIAVSLGFVALAERAEALQAIDFASAWSEVQRINNGIAAEKANVERTELMVEATRSLYLPRVDLVGAYTRLDSPAQLNALDLNPLAAVRGTPIGSEIIESIAGDAAFTSDLTERSFGTAALTAKWPVYTGGRTSAAQDISAAQRDVARQQFNARHRVVFEELVAAYFGVVLQPVLQIQPCDEH